MLCKRKGVHIVEAEMCPDHVHMLVEIPPSMSVSSFVGYLKGKSILMIFERHANLKYKYGNRHFWCRGYYVDTVGKNAKKIQEYIQNQLKEDLEYALNVRLSCRSIMGMGFILAKRYRFVLNVEPISIGYKNYSINRSLCILQ